MKLFLNISSFIFLIFILSLFDHNVVNSSQLCNYYPFYPNNTQSQIIGCREACCPNYPVKPTDACCRYKEYNFDAESVAIIIITVIAFLVFNIIVFTIVLKIFLNWKRKRNPNNSNLRIPNAHVLSQQQPSNSYQMSELTSPPSYQNLSIVPNEFSQNSTNDKQSIDTDYLPKYDYLNNPITNSTSTSEIDPNRK